MVWHTHTNCANCGKNFKLKNGQGFHGAVCDDCKKSELEGDEENYLNYLKNTYTLEERVERIEKALFKMNGEDY